MDRRIISADRLARPFGARGGIRLLAVLALALAAAACGRGPTEDVLRGGVPARTNLHQTTGLPSESVRTVNRNDAGWRVIFHPARAPLGAEQQAARALCGLENRRVSRIERLALDAPADDPGAVKFDIICA